MTGAGHGSMSRALAFVGVALWMAAMPQTALAKRPAAKASEEAALTSQGVAQLIADLRERESELELKRRELAERERSIAELEAQLDRRLAELDAIRAEVEKRIEAWSTQDGSRITRLAKVYSEMPPSKVAPLLQSLELNLATSILSRMKDKKSAAILAQMSRGQALSMSRRLARPLGTAPEAGR